MPQAAPVRSDNDEQPSISRGHTTSPKTPKRKRTEANETHVATKPSKKRKHDEQPGSITMMEPPEVHKVSKKRTQDSKRTLSGVSEQDVAMQEAAGAKSDEVIDELAEKYSKQKIKANKSRKFFNKGADSNESRSKNGNHSRGEVVTSQIPKSGEEDTDEGEAYLKNLVHETVSSTAPSTAVQSRKKHYTPEGESKTQRDERTLFIGNLSPSILKAKVIHTLLLEKLGSQSITNPPVVSAEGS
jgi:nucleolar protein 12